jgi:hypothetical protein
MVMNPLSPDAHQGELRPAENISFWLLVRRAAHVLIAKIPMM